MAHEDAGNAGDGVDEVVTCFLRHRGEVLLVRRSGRVGSYRGRWGGISGFAEGDALEAAWREIAEETGLEGAVSLVKQGEPFGFDDADEGHRWRVHPFLFDASSHDARLDWEAEEGVWVSPAEILTRRTVPRLWTSYARAAPTLADIRADREHGSAWLSLRALEALRDRAAALAAGAAEAPSGAGAELTGLARELAAARPAMTVVRNRVDRAMTRALAGMDAASGEGADAVRAAAVRDAAEAVLGGAVAAEEGAAAAVARAAAARRVLTLSSSGTVTDGLLSASPPPARVVVCESRPGGEGRALAARLREAGIDAVLVPDAAVAWALEAEGVELLVVGADTVLEDGGVVNKVGTRPAALAARAVGVRVLAAASSAKIAARGEAWSGEGAEAPETGPLEAGSSEAGAAEGGATADGADQQAREPRGRRAVRRRAPLFERTPAGLIDGILTERGELGATEVEGIAAEHAADRGWDRGRT